MTGLTYIIIDDCPDNTDKIKNLGDDYQDLLFIASADTYETALNLVLAHNPKIIFLCIDSKKKESQLSIHFIDVLHRYLTILPKIIVMAKTKDLAFEAINYQVSGYLVKPIQKNEFFQSLLVIVKNSHLEQLRHTVNPFSTDFGEPTFISSTIPAEKSLLLCVKSYGDYRYIRANEVVYFQADNNSTDIYLQSGEMITAFKTLKHFEGLLQDPFYRIHNSYLINTNYIARIHTGSKMCTLRNATKRIPFSRSYKTNIDLIIERFSEENYLEV